MIKKTVKKTARTTKPVRKIGQTSRLPTRTLSIVPHSAVEKVCALTDPFCPHAMGAMYPDGNGSYTVPFQSRFLVTATTDANGNGAWLFTLGSPDYTYANYSSIVNATGGAITFASPSVDPNYSGLYTSNFASVRCVNAGIHFQTTQSWSTATGWIICGTGTAGQVTGGYKINTFNGLMTAEMHPVRDANIIMVARPSDSTALTDFLPLDNTSGTANDPITMPIFFSTTGGTANTVIGTFEVVINYEFRTTPGSLMSQMATPSANRNERLIELAAQVRSQIPPVIADQATAAFGSVVRGLASSAIRGLIGAHPLGRAALAAARAVPAIEVD